MNSLKGVTSGRVIGVTKQDTRRLDYGAHLKPEFVLHEPTCLLRLRLGYVFPGNSVCLVMTP